MSSDMAHNVEPMDIDCINSDFDNKENTFNHNNALPCTEKGYEELDVSELNMKLRYSLTPNASPMSKSFTNCTDNSFDSDDAFNHTLNESNLTRSLNSTITKNENLNKSFKTLPLQSLPTDQNTDKSISVQRQSDSAIKSECNSMMVKISGTSDMEDNISLSSTTSSVLNTPEATTPTKETKTDGGSPILRGLKSVLNMFRSSQSPITPVDTNSVVNKPERLNSVEAVQSKSTENFDFKPQSMASTPIAAPRLKENSGSRRSSPYKDSIVFNDDLEKELQWKDETTIIFSHEKIPVHKLFFQQAKTIPKSAVNQLTHVENIIEGNFKTDIIDTQCNEPVVENKTISDVQEEVIDNECTVCNDSDSEFVDCETTFIKNDSNILDNIQNKLSVENNVVDINPDLENNKDYLGGKVDELNTTASPSQVQNIEHDNSFHLMIDSLDGVVNEKLSPVEFSAENNLKTDETTLQLDNTISKLKEITPKTGLENNVCSEYELDSLEYNCMTKTNDINITNNNDNVISDRIDDSLIQDTKIAGEVGSMSNRNLPLPTEIPLPDDDYNEIEVNMKEKTVELSNNLILLISEEANAEAQDSLGEITAFQNLPTVETRTDELLIKNEEVNKTLNANAAFIEEEINTIKVQDTENLVSFIKNSNVNNEQNVIQDKDQICPEFKNVGISKSCENKISSNDSMNQCKSLYSVDEITSECLINEEGQNDDTKLPCGTAGTNFMMIDQNADCFIKTEKYNGILDVSHIPDEMIITDLVISSQVKENKAEITLSNVNKENIISNFQSKEILENTLPKEHHLNNILDEHKDNFVKEKIVAKLVSNTDAEEIILIENMACNLNIMENSQKHEVILEANKTLSEEITKENSDESVAYQLSNKELLEVNDIFDANVIEIDQNTHNNEYLGTNLVHKDFEDTDKLIDNKIEKINTDIQVKFENLLEKVITDNITIEQASEAVSNEHKLENTIQNNSEDIKAIHLKERSVDEITSDMNISTIHTETPETLEINTTLKNNIPEENFSDMLGQISIEKSKSINLDADQMKEINLDKNLTISTNYLHKDDNINELDTFTLEEEIVFSENNSPYVSVAGDLDKVTIGQNSATLILAEDANTTVTLSSSPPITSKGYNFNFDEMDDPFATKTVNTKSPTLESNSEYAVLPINNTNLDQPKTPKKVLGNNRRTTQFERKKQFVSTQKHNKSFSAGTSFPETLINADKLDDNCSTENNIFKEKAMKSTTDSDNDGNLLINNDIPLKTIDYDKNDLVDVTNASNCNRSVTEECSNNQINKSIIETITDKSSTDHKNSLSSDQSSYYSNGISSSEVIKSRNVFNLPEIDDMNFNPFAVKAKLCQSPPPNIDEDNPFVTRTKLIVSPETSHVNIETPNTDTFDKLVNKDCEDKMDTEPMEKVASANRSSDTNSSTISQKDTTVREINTEDEDTIEGPFIDDINNDEMSYSDTDNVDMMKCNDMPNQENEDNADGELFIDAEAFQFLLNQNKSNVVADSGKESLFLKFDPLFAKKISSDSIITALNKVQNKQSTPIKTEKRESIITITASSPTSNTTFEKENVNNTEINTDNLNITVSKPMMVVPPAVNAIATPRKSQTPTRTNRHSCTFTSPAMAVIDRLLSLSTNNSLVEHEASFTQVSREQTEANLALTQLRELLAEKEIQVYNLRSESKDLKDRLLVLESHMRTLETESQQRLNKIDELTETLSKKTNMDRNMAVVFEEYESTIANLIAQIEKEKKQHAEERNALINERNEQTAHLTNMEVSFNDLHSKYEKIKQVIANYKTNEESYKKTLISYEENFKKAQNNYELLKQHATSKLNYANEELQKLNKAHEAEVLKMNAMIKRKDLHITSLEETLAQKTKANEELTAICDELINKVG